LWDDLSPAELAAVVSTVIYENRRPDGGSPQIPGGAVKATLDSMAGLWSDLRDVESRHGLAFVREPDAGFAWAAFRWASGAQLEEILQDDPDLTAGDFVRWCKQLVDVLGHISTVAQEPVRSTARASLAAVRHGVVTYSSVS
jgi:ATP-dependent RNA helicase HelY